MTFSPLLQRIDVGTIGESNIKVLYKDFIQKGEKVIVVFEAKLPQDYIAETDWIVPRMYLHSEAKVTFNKVMITKSDMDFEEFSSYEVASRVLVDNGAFSLLPEGTVLNIAPEAQFDVAAGSSTSWMEGAYISEQTNPVFQPGDIITIYYFFNITEVVDPNGFVT